MEIKQRPPAFPIQGQEKKNNTFCGTNMWFMFLHLPRIIQAYYLHYEVFLLIVIVLMQRHTLHPCLELIYSSSKKKKRSPKSKQSSPQRPNTKDCKALFRAIKIYLVKTLAQPMSTASQTIPDRATLSYAFSQMRIWPRTDNAAPAKYGFTQKPGLAGPTDRRSSIVRPIFSHRGPS